MKKIYALLAAACISTSAFAAFDTTKQYNFEGLKNPNVSLKELAAKSSNFEMTESPKGIQKIVNMNDNTEWTALMANNGKMTDLFRLTDKEGNVATFEQFPFYILIFSTQPEDPNSSEIYQAYIQWPAYGVFDDELWPEGSKEIDMEACRAKYGDKALQPYSFEDFYEINEGGLLIALPGIYAMPCILGSELFGEDFTQTNANGQQVYMKSATVTGDGKIQYGDATTIDWKAYDMDSSSINLVYNGKFSNTIGGAVTSQTSLDLNGEAVVLGFTDIEWDTIGEVHIFNAGAQTYGDEFTWNYLNAFDGVLNFYYLAMCDKTMSYNVVNQETGEEMANYTDIDLPKAVSGSRTSWGAPSYAVASPIHYIYFAGALWAKENSQYPYGVWKMKEPAVDSKGNYKQVPEANNLVVYTSQADGTQDGLHGSYEGYLQVGMPEECEIGIGDKTNGLNFKFGTSLNYGHSIWGKFTDNIIFHNTPNQWTKFEALPAVANENANVLDNSTGVESVESNSPVVSKSFYNFQGQRLSSEPESGLYIIRSVKADGTVKAEKVAK